MLKPKQEERKEKSTKRMGEGWNYIQNFQRAMIQWIYASRRIFSLWFREDKFPLVFTVGAISKEQVDWWFDEFENLYKRRKEMDKTYYKFLHELEELKPKQK